MSQAAIYIKTESETKEKAQKVAKELGLSLSAVVNRYLKLFIKTKQITFNPSEEEPSDYLIKLMKKAQKDRKEGKASPVFDNTKDAIAWLHRKE